MAALRSGVDAVFFENVGNGTPGNDMAEVGKRPHYRREAHSVSSFAMRTVSFEIVSATRGQPGPRLLLPFDPAGQSHQQKLPRV